MRRYCISLREMLGRLVSFVKRQQRDDDFQEELNAHLQLASDEYRRRGMRDDEARRRALIDFGGVEAAKEVHRHARGMAGVESVLKDLRYAFRQLCQSPVFAATAVLSLALGIGGTTGIFSLIYSVLLHPYPYAGADRMVQVSTEDESGNLRLVSLGGSQVQVMRKAKFVDDAIAWQNWELNTTGGDLPEDVKAVFITPNASTYFGLPPLLGRGLMPSDVSQPVVVLTQSFWQRHFGGRTDIIGKQLQLAHKDYRIVGVLPSRFTWNGGDVYLPLKMTYASDQLYGVGIKLKPGVGLRAANAEFDALLHQFAKETPAYFPHRFRAHMERLNAMYANAFGGSLYLLLGAVTFLLLIGCANVSILLLSRGMLRRRELAIRAAVGASRSRIFRQLLTESFLLSLTGAVLGLVIAYGILPVAGKWLPLYFPSQAATVQINVPVLLFCMALALLTGILFGLAPALQLSHPDLAGRGEISTRSSTGSVRSRRTHNVLIAGQLALTMVLLAGAGAATEGLARLMHVSLGYDPQNTLAVDIPLHQNTYTQWEQRAAYFERLQKQVATIPEVTDVAISSYATPPSNGVAQRFDVRGELSQDERQARLSFISANYFSTLRIPLLRGRVWSSGEGSRGLRMAVINEAMAKRYWPHGNAVGSTVRMPGLHGRPPYGLTAPHSDDWFQIVGVVRNARNDGLMKPVKPAAYLPYTFFMDVGMNLLVHTHVTPLSVLHSIRKKVQAVDSDQQIGGYVPTLDELVAIQPEWKQEQLVSFLFDGFALMALVLAIAGLYSVVSYGVAQRTKEFGIRIALGARRRDVVWAVLRSTMLSVGGGLGAGLILIVVLRGVMRQWTASSTNDPLLMGCVGLFMVGVTLLACLTPAFRAASIEPVTALRED